jgi:predicted N-acetyltransferase YhbS
VLELGEEKPEDWWEIEALFDLAFGPGREALSSYRLRDGIDPVPGLSLILRDEAAIIGGAIRFWPVRVGDAETLLLGPVAVHPTHQGEGLGAYLIENGLERAVALGWLRVLLVGDEPYYGRFGFHRLTNVEMPPPTNPARVLGRALGNGAWEGVQGRVVRAEGAGEVA